MPVIKAASSNYKAFRPATASAGSWSEVFFDDTASIMKGDYEAYVVQRQWFGDNGRALNLYLNALGGNHVWLFFLSYIGGLVLTQLLNMVQTWWLATGPPSTKAPTRLTFMWPRELASSLF
ncbi:hypothetical protein BDZ89DRAFT_1055209 [Hymenopellis radicata]|nr:hypothetical protein BDZ89DRAFT_1055209 [Hymenopellis radicata]